jgi:hypothetical protein
MAKSKKSRVRRFGGRVKRRVKAAKPSLAIAAGLGIPAVLVVTGSSNAYGTKGFSTNWQELRARFQWTYLGGTDPGGNVNVGRMVQSTAVKAGALGFIVHYLANLSGANRYLARMKAPVRI